MFEVEVLGLFLAALEKGLRRFIHPIEAERGGCIDWMEWKENEE